MAATAPVYRVGGGHRQPPSACLVQQQMSDAAGRVAAGPGGRAVRVPEGDLGIGADILTRAATSDEFESANDTYFDNDSGQFARPHPDAMDARKRDRLVQLIGTIIATHSNGADQ